MRGVGALASFILLTVCANTAAAESFVEQLTGPHAAARLRGNDPTERRHAALLLGRYGARRAAVESLKRALDEERDPDVRSAIIQSLAKRGDVSAVPALVTALEQGTATDRNLAGSVLGAFGTDAALRGLASALNNADAQSAARIGLERAGPAAVPHLLRELRLSTSKASVIDALGAIQDPRIIDSLIPYTRDTNEDVRVAAVAALTSIGDDRAIRAVRACLADDSERVRLAAVQAVSRLGSTNDYAAMQMLAERGAPAQRAEALRAMFILDPRRGARAVGSVLHARDAILLTPATEIALSSTHPAAVPLLHGLLHAGGVEDRAAHALARIDGGAGIPALLREAQQRGEIGRAATDGLAVALRMWGEQVPSSDRAKGIERIRKSGDERGPRTLFMRAVARDEGVASALVAALRSSDDAERESAATALGVLGDRDERSAVVAALARERDPDTFRSMALAAVRLGGGANLPELLRMASDTAVAPEAMWLAVHSLDDATPEARRRLRELLRRNLDSSVARVRAGAALALGALRDGAAWHALVDCLDDDTTQVRRSAARALEMLAVEEAVPALEAQWRAEEDEGVRGMIEDAIASPHRRPRLHAADVGREVAWVRIATTPTNTNEPSKPSTVPPTSSAPPTSASPTSAPPTSSQREASESEPVGGRLTLEPASDRARGARAAPPQIELLLPGGQWWWVRTLPSGELIVTDLPRGKIDAHLRKPARR